MNTANSTSTPKARTIVFRIKRCDGPGKPSRWESFRVPVEPGANVISCLNWIAAHPVTAEGKKTTPVVWQCVCLEEVCGSCTMVINGHVRQSCSCLLDVIAPNDGDTVSLEPMSKFPVVRDLWVDRSRAFKALERIKGWVPIDSLYDLGPGPKETPAAQQMRYKLSECMTCGCCMEACPQFVATPDESQWETTFIGAHAISQARYFNANKTGAQLKGERLDALMGPGGISDCGNAQNCVKVCPKEIPLTESIGSIGQQSTIHAIAKWFGGK